MILISIRVIFKLEKTIDIISYPREKKKKLDEFQTSTDLNGNKVLLSKWFISEKLLPVLRLDVEFFNCLIKKNDLRRLPLPHRGKIRKY